MKWNRRTVLVTGGAGLIGSRIVRRLVQLGVTVKVLDHLSAYLFNQLKHFGLEELLKDIELIIGCIEDESVVHKAMQGIDIVFHEAAFADVAATMRNPEEDFKSNVLGTFNLLKAAKDNNVNRFIFASSAAVYGELPWGNSKSPPKFSEDMKTNPISTYANSKLWCEKETLLFHKLYGLKTTSLRYFSVYGEPQIPKERSHSWVVTIFVMRLLKNKPLMIFGDGTQVRDFVHIDNITEATIIAAEKQSTIGKIINVGTGRLTTIKELAEIVNNLTDVKVPIKYRSRPKGDPLGGYADTTLMKKLLEWEPKIKLEEGVSRYYEWARSNKNIIPQWL